VPTQRDIDQLKKWIGKYNEETTRLWKTLSPVERGWVDLPVEEVAKPPTSTALNCHHADEVQVGEEGKCTTLIEGGELETIIGTDLGNDRERVFRIDTDSAAATVSNGAAGKIHIFSRIEDEIGFELRGPLRRQSIFQA
jgi:hypothetical protein